MRREIIVVGVLLFFSGQGFAESISFWDARMGRGDGRLEAQSFRVVQTPSTTGRTVQTLMPAHGATESRVTVELDAHGNLVRSRAEYLVAALSDWYRADLLLTEAQRGATPGGGDNLAFQRVWKNEVQEAKNLAWGADFVEFATLPFLLERRLAEGKKQTWRFQTYFTDIPGTMEVTFRVTDEPLAVESRYAYPRWLRERFGNRRVVLAELNGVGDFKGAYPYPFYYVFTTGANPEWIAAWGGSPQATSFQWEKHS